LIMASLLITCPWPGVAINVKGAYGASEGGVSFNILSNLDDSTGMSSEISLNQLTLDKITTASGSGENSIQESVSNGGNDAVQTVISSGSMDMRSSTVASGNGIESTQQSGLAGDGGYIGNSLSSPSNDIDLFGGFSGDGGYLNANIESVTAGSAGLAGSANIMGDEYLNPEVTDTMNSLPGTVLKSVDGLFLTQNGDIGSFGLNVLKDEKNGRNVGSGSQDSTLYGTLYRWPNNPAIKLYLNTKNLPTGITSSAAAKAINDAANKWDQQTKQNLFYGSDTSSNVVSTTTTYTPNFNKVDYKNIHAFSRYNDPNVIAVTNTWYYPSGYYRPGLTATNGDPLGMAVDSDCIYNTAFKWTITPSNTAFEVGDIALHELGHTLGLADFYGTSQYNWVMYGYRGLADTPRTLTPDDIKMLRYLYGP
jgi:hypothetical protein